MISRQRIVMVSLETEAGTAVSGATAVLAFDPKMDRADTFKERTPSWHTAGQMKGEHGERYGTFSCRCELLPAAAGGSLDAGLSILLQGCGLQFAAGVYKPLTAIASQKAVTIDLNEGGKLKRIYGAMGSFKLTPEFGKGCDIEFEFSGKWAAPVDAAMPTPTLNRSLPLKGAGSVLTLDAWTPTLDQVTFDAGATISPRKDMGDATWISQFACTDRKPQFSFAPESVSVATQDIHGQMEAATELAMSLALTDGTTTVTLEAPKLQYRAIVGGEREGFATDDITAQCNVDSGDDEWTLTVA